MTDAPKRRRALWLHGGQGFCSNGKPNWCWRVFRGRGPQHRLDVCGECFTGSCFSNAGQLCGQPGPSRTGRPASATQEQVEHGLSQKAEEIGRVRDFPIVVTDMAVAAESIDEAKAEDARQRAVARLREHLFAEEVASVKASLARSLAQLKVKRRRR